MFKLMIAASSWMRSAICFLLIGAIACPSLSFSQSEEDMYSEEIAYQENTYSSQTLWGIAAASALGGGVVGASLCHGKKGEKGSSGHKGRTGPAGLPGPAGALGPQGPAGPGFDIQTGPASLAFTFVNTPNISTGVEFAAFVVQPDQTITSTLPLPADATPYTIIIPSPAQVGTYHIVLHTISGIDNSSDVNVTVTNSLDADVSQFSDLHGPFASPGSQITYEFTYNPAVIFAL
jgi:hypothetical protein